MKVDAYCHKKLVLKAFFGLLKFVESAKTKKLNDRAKPQTQKKTESTMLGIVKVVPVIDKNVEEAYPCGEQMRSTGVLPDVLNGSEDESLTRILDFKLNQESQDFG